MRSSPPELLRAAIEAHGGADRWARVDEIVVRASGRGFALRSKLMPPRWFGRYEAHISTREPRSYVVDWPQAGRRGVFDGDDVRLETDAGEVLAERRGARASFHGLRTVRWDLLHLAYFAGYAWWGYINQPFLFTLPGFRSREIEPWRQGGETWRRLAVRFPENVPAHSRDQVIYFDESLRVRRNDYTGEVFGRWARAAHLSDVHREFGGLLFPTRRRVYPRGPGNRPMPFPLLVGLDIESVEPVSAAPAP